MTELLQKRIKFTGLIAQLITWINQQGKYQVVIGQDGLKHMPGSLHFCGLAEDLLLYKDGEYLTDDATGAYKDAGEYWKSLDSDCCWGGDFQSVDLDHFSIRFQGKK